MSSSQATAFGALREIVHARASPESWQRLCELLDGWDVDELEQLVVPYVGGLLAHWDDALKRAPQHWLQRLERGGATPQLELVRVVVRESHSVDILELLTSSALRHLVELDLRGLAIYGTAREHLGRLKPLPQLHKVNLQESRYHQGGFDALIDSPLLAEVSKLNLRGSRIDNLRLRGLISDSPMTRPVVLNLRNNHIGFEGAIALASCARFGDLVELDLAYNHLGMQGMEPLAQGDNMPMLRRLDLSSNIIQPDGGAAILASPQLAGVETLCLHNNNLDDSAMVALAHSPHVRQLRALYLSSNAIGSAGMRALAASEQLVHLVHLDLRDNHIGDDGAMALARCANMPALRRLELRDNFFGDRVVDAFVDGPLLGQLTYFNIANSRITDRGWRQLAAAPQLPAYLREWYTRRFSPLLNVHEKAFLERLGLLAGLGDEPGHVAERW